MAAVGALALAFTAACSSSAKAPSTQTGSVNVWNTWNTAAVKDGGSITVAIEKQLGDWNPLDGTISADQIYTLDPIYSASAFIYQPDASVILNSDTMVSAEQSSSSPETITYKIKPNAVWSDGTPINADDFVYTWLTNSGVDPNMTNAGSTGYNQIQSVVGSDNGKTVTVTFATPFPDWKALFGPLLPAHIAAQHGYNTALTMDQLTKDVKAEAVANGVPTSTGDVLGLEKSFAWFSNNVPPVSSGPYVIQTAASDNSSVTEVPNPKWYGAKAHLDQITYKVITDATQEPTALANGEVNVIYPQPETDLVTQIKGMGSKVKYQVAAGSEFEHFDFNMASPALGGKTEADQEAPDKVALRQAMLIATDRKGIIARTVGLFDSASKPLNSRFFNASQQGYQDNITKYQEGSGDLNAAEQVLKKAGFTGVGTALKYPDGTAVPAMTMRYTEGNQIRETECNLFKSDMAKLGITINVQTTSSLGKSLTHVSGYDYDIIVFAWVTTPFPNSGNYSVFVSAKTQGGMNQNYAGYANSQVDTLYQKASSDFNTTEVNSTLNQIDNILSQDAVTLPLYTKDEMVAMDSDLANIRINSTSQLFTYNTQQWGFMAATASATPAS